MNNPLSISVKGHCHAVDDLGTVLIDKNNAIHPQNMARVIARALANEPHSSIYRMAFGNGGTVVDAAYTITYRTPNDGQSPDVETWGSRIYNETYSEIVDEGDTALNPLLGTDPGSADAYTGVRPGGGAVPSADPTSVPHVSGPGVRSVELDLMSEVIITCVLNANEPVGQATTDGITTNTESSFTFDEIGLYTEGAPAIKSSGYQSIAFGNQPKTSLDDTKLVSGNTYRFNIAINGGSPQTIQFTPPPSAGSGADGEILYGDLCEAINTANTTWAFVPAAPNAIFKISDSSGAFPSIQGSQTSGRLIVSSPTVGSASTIDLSGSDTNTFLVQLNSPTGSVANSPVVGSAAGLQNAPTTPTLQRERLLAHLTFSPVLKAANRSITITYTITVSVDRST